MMQSSSLARGQRYAACYTRILARASRRRRAPRSIATFASEAGRLITERSLHLVNRNTASSFNPGAKERRNQETCQTKRQIIRNLALSILAPRAPRCNEGMGNRRQRQGDAHQPGPHLGAPAPHLALPTRPRTPLDGASAHPAPSAPFPGVSAPRLVPAASRASVTRHSW